MSQVQCTRGRTICWAAIVGMRGSACIGVAVFGFFDGLTTRQIWCSRVRWEGGKVGKAAPSACRSCKAISRETLAALSRSCNYSTSDAIRLSGCDQAVTSSVTAPAKLHQPPHQDRRVPRFRGGICTRYDAMRYLLTFSSVDLNPSSSSSSSESKRRRQDTSALLWQNREHGQPRVAQKALSVRGLDKIGSRQGGSQPCARTDFAIIDCRRLPSCRAYCEVLVDASGRSREAAI